MLSCRDCLSHGSYKYNIGKYLLLLQERNIIANVYNFLYDEYKFTNMYSCCKCDFTHFRNITGRTAKATKVSIRTVVQVLKEQKERNKIIPPNPSGPIEIFSDNDSDDENTSIAENYSNSTEGRKTPEGEIKHESESE